MLALTKYFYKSLILGLIIITFYNIFFILILLFNHKIEGFLLKTWKYSPYNYSELFKKTAGYSKKHLLIKNKTSKKLYFLMTETENKSLLDYNYWNNKMIYLISKKEYSDVFEKSFQNSYILSKNNSVVSKINKLFYLRNIPKFGEDTKKLVLSK
tara:strand:+ start:635 stop:1099 length:465 start_codon:yes stop_codon:yes gene_type:complete